MRLMMLITVSVFGYVEYKVYESTGHLMSVSEWRGEAVELYELVRFMAGM